MRIRIFLFLFFVLIIVFIFSCREDKIITNENTKLVFSTDTLSFDTVFTTIGSATKYFTVKNPNSNTIEISSVFLAGSENSPFRLNIDGVPSNKESNIRIPAGDSLYIFVETTIDPTAQNNPMVIQDSIVFNLNGNFQDVDLIAFGQDFHLFNGEVIQTQHWVNDKPYLIYNSILVDSLETLIVDPGCRIHFHKNSSLFVKGTLLVNGTVEDPVVFQGDRLEEDYKNIPGQWGAYRIFENGGVYVYGGIHLLQGSIDNIINYAEIKNAEKGIQVDSLGNSTNPVLTLTNTKIGNMTLNCLDARTTFIKASNCIFSNSGSSCVALPFGGNYEFYHCTIANYYGETTREYPALYLKNYYEYENSKFLYYNLEATFGNCIVFGNNNVEIGLYENYEAEFNFLFKNCLLKTSGYSEFTGENYLNTIYGSDPKFKNISVGNFSLDSLSVARNFGNLEIANQFPLDLNSISRLTDEGPDLGAIEFISASDKN